jgi:hypothetical protein
MEPEGSLPCSLVPILSQMNPVHTTPSYFTKIQFNIILLSTSAASCVLFLIWGGGPTFLSSKIKREIRILIWNIVDIKIRRV